MEKQNVEDQFRLEEYKFLTENLRNFDDKCYHTRLICLAAYGIIFGFSKLIPAPFILLAMLAVLWLSLATFRFYNRKHRLLEAFLIHKYENNIKGLNFHRYIYDFGNSLRPQKYTLRLWPKKIIEALLPDSYVILTLILVGCYCYFGWHYIKDSHNLDYWWDFFIKNFHWLYFIISVVGLCVVGWHIYIYLSKGLSSYIKEITDFENLKANTQDEL